MIGNGKLVEDLRYLRMTENMQFVAAGTYYDGSATAPTLAANALDTQPYDEVVFIISPAHVPASQTLDTVVWAHSTPAASSGAAVTGATFNQTTNASKVAQVGAVKCDAQKRYMWLRTVKAGSSTCYMSAIAVLGKGPASHPISNSATFDV